MRTGLGKTASIDGDSYYHLSIANIATTWALVAPYPHCAKGRMSILRWATRLNGALMSFTRSIQQTRDFYNADMPAKRIRTDCVLDATGEPRSNWPCGS